MSSIGLFSLEADLHVHAVAAELQKRNVPCHIFVTDAQIDMGGVTWSTKPQSPLLRSYGQEWVEVEGLSTIWWRRVNQAQGDQGKFLDSATFEFVNSEWRSSIFGLISDSFRGTWVNNPKYDSLAGNKIFQLTRAKEVGLRVPETLVSSNPEAIQEFFEEQADRVIVKKLQGTGSTVLATVAITFKELESFIQNAYVCPSMYQEKIEGSRHLRVHCFGNDVHAVLIESEDLDWRRNLNCKFSNYSLDEQTSEKLRNLLRLLNLEMGIMDLMITKNGEIVWLEINPQGQFLFAEGLSGLDLKGRFAEFLLSTGLPR